MKKIFCSLTLTLSSLFAQTVDEPSEDSARHANVTYFKIGGALIPCGDQSKIAPSFALGERFERGNHAIDLSLTTAWFSRNYYFAIPKVMYLYYFDFNLSHGLYGGGGLSYGQINNQDSHKKFSGILGDVAIGYEWMRSTSVRTFVEFNVSKSAISLSDNDQSTSPIFSLSFGIGF